MVPSQVKLLKGSKVLRLYYDADPAHPDGEHHYDLSFEFLRVHSPSAEVRGHSEADRVLQKGKKHVLIKSIEAVGNYAIKPTFDDGHDTGIFSWNYLYDLALNQHTYWQTYLQELHEAHASRDPDTQVVQLFSPPKSK